MGTTSNNTTSPSSTTSSATTEQNQDNFSSQQLASKLRKIKQNLDNCYIVNGTTTTATNLDVSDYENNDQSLGNSFKSINRIPITYVSPQARTQQPNNARVVNVSHLPLNNPNSNHVNEKRTSLDHILDQFTEPSLNSFKYGTVASKNIYNRVIPIYSDSNVVEFIPNGRIAENANQGIKQAVYSENVSRQSSIRSLIINTSENNSIKSNGKPTVSQSNANFYSPRSNEAKPLITASVAQIKPTKKPTQLVNGGHDSVRNGPINGWLQEPLASRLETRLDFQNAQLTNKDAENNLYVSG
jgi:hypothetical protein